MNRLNLLIIDDEPSILTALKFLFHRLYHVTTMASGQAALDYIVKENYRVELVICDQRMAGMFGHEFIRHIHQQSPTSICMLCTGYPDLEELVMAVNEGHIFSYIRKPWDNEEMKLHIKKSADFYQLNAQNDCLSEQLQNANKKLEQRVQKRTCALQKVNEQLEIMAKFDPLTGLANRGLFQEFLSKTLVVSKRNSRKFIVIFIDLDNFKKINDSLGHDAGDALLKSVAVRMRALVRKSDIVARFGGDEFAMVVEEIKQFQDAAYIVQKIIASLSEPHDLAGRRVVASPSIGIATYPNCGTEVETLLKAADTAMYSAKAQGRNTYQFYNQQMHNTVLRRLQFEDALRQALNTEEFDIGYQPQIDTSTNVVFGIEAMLLWRSAQFGQINAAQLMPIAEEIGIMVDIGEWMLDRICRQNQLWRNDPLISTNPKLSMHISMQQLSNRLYQEKIQSILDSNRVDVGDLRFEFAESMVMQDPDASVIMLHDIHNMGIEVMINNFGTGYTSLHHLQQFPLNVLKIDSSFVEKIGDNKRADAVIKAIMAIADSMSLKIIAEGVCEEAQYHYLQAQGCQQMQGDYFCPMFSAQQTTNVLRAEKMLGTHGQTYVCAKS